MLNYIVLILCNSFLRTWASLQRCALPPMIAFWNVFCKSILILELSSILDTPYKNSHITLQAATHLCFFLYGFREALLLKVTEYLTDVTWSLYTKVCCCFFFFFFWCVEVDILAVVILVNGNIRNFVLWSKIKLQCLFYCWFMMNFKYSYWIIEFRQFLALLFLIEPLFIVSDKINHKQCYC